MPLCLAALVANLVAKLLGSIGRSRSPRINLCLYIALLFVSWVFEVIFVTYFFKDVLH